jgi:hypothetical protein
MVWRNFVVSVWVLIGWSAWQSVVYWFGLRRMRAAFRPFTMNFVLWPAAIGLMELMFWYAIFRHRGSGTRVMAAFMGLAVFIQAVFVPLVNAGLYDHVSANFLRLALYSYVSISHLAVAVAPGAVRRG